MSTITVAYLREQWEKEGKFLHNYLLYEKGLHDEAAEKLLLRLEVKERHSYLAIK